MDAPGHGRDRPLRGVARWNPNTNTGTVATPYFRIQSSVKVQISRKAVASIKRDLHVEVGQGQGHDRRSCLSIVVSKAVIQNNFIICSLQKN